MDGAVANHRDMQAVLIEYDRVRGYDHRQRLAHFVLTHASGEGVLRMTQQQIARHLGTTREVIARLVQELVARGLIRSQRGSIGIRDLAGLRAVSGLNTPR